MSDRILDYQAGIEHLIAQLQSLTYYGKYVPGSIVPSFTSIAWGDIKGNIEDQKDLMAQLNKLHKEIEDAIIGTLSSVFIYKGSVATVADLPTKDLESGYCYNVEADGANYVWNGSEWDKLSETIDLSGYVEKTELEETLELYYLKTEIDNIINAMAVDLGTQINLKADKTEVTELRDYVVELNNSIVDGVNAEINARKAADTSINERIDNVILDTNTAIDNLDTKLENHIADAEAHSATKEELTDETNARIAADNLLDDRIDVLENKDFVEYKDISNPENPNRKAIILNNHDGIFGKDTEGNTRTLGMISKYNVADFGNPHLHTNLNTQQIVTVNDNQAVLTDKNMDQIILPGDNVVIDKETKVDPTTGFEFQTLTINAELSGTDRRIDELAAELDQETQARTEKDTALENKFNNYMDIETTANYVTGEIDNLANTVSQLYVGKSEIYDNYLVDYYQKTETYSKDQVDELIQDIDAGQLRADLDQEIQDRQTADEALDTRIEALEAKTEAIFHYRGAVSKVSDLPQIDNEVGDTYNVEETGANYCWNGTSWDKLSETVDLSAYDLIADRQAADNKIISKIWNQSNLDTGYFQTKATTNKGTAMIWNESDGGGSKYEGADGLWAYTGVNEGTAGKVSDTEGNILTGRANEVMGQIYVYDSKNAGDDRITAINMTRNAFYYKHGANSNVTVDDEIAVIGDVNLVQNGLDSLSETVENTLATQDGNIQALLLKMEELQSKIEDLKSLDYEVITLYDGADTDYDNEEKSFQLSGAIKTRLVVAGENVTLDEATIESAFVELDAIEDITIKDSTYSGNTPKVMSNAIFKLHADGYVSVRDCTVTPEKAYNGIEVGLSQGLAKSVIIDNVRFDGSLTNNAINIFGMDDGGVVTISNCYFKKVSNLIRISNRTNTSWTINIINCVCDEWETGEYAGMILLQDYTSGSAAQANENDMFAKLTINIQNCTKPDGTKIVPVDDLSTICGTQDDNQIIYMWDSWRGHTSYGDKYPTINII